MAGRAKVSKVRIKVSETVIIVQALPIGAV